LHQAAYDALGLDWEYGRTDVRSDEVGSFVAGLSPVWRGLSVTMPCKAAIVSLGVPDPVVAALGVGNTLIFDGDPGDPTTTHVHSTDVTGIQMVLSQARMSPHACVQVYGNGATARSCVYALSLMGVGGVHVRARDAEKTAALALDGRRWGIEVVDGDCRPDVVVSTLPPQVSAQWGPASAGLVVDVVYDPWPTPLIHQAIHQGAQVVTGLDLLAAQAVGQVELMTGRRVDLAVLRTAADRAIAEQAA